MGNQRITIKKNKKFMLNDDAYRGRHTRFPWTQRPSDVPDGLSFPTRRYVLAAAEIKDGTCRLHEYSGEVELTYRQKC